MFKRNELTLPIPHDSALVTWFCISHLLTSFVKEGDLEPNASKIKTVLGN